MNAVAQCHSQIHDIQQDQNLRQWENLQSLDTRISEISIPFLKKA